MKSKFIILVIIMPTDGKQWTVSNNTAQKSHYPPANHHAIHL